MKINIFIKHRSVLLYPLIFIMGLLMFITYLSNPVCACESGQYDCGDGNCHSNYLDCDGGWSCEKECKDSQCCGTTFGSCARCSPNSCTPNNCTPVCQDRTNEYGNSESTYTAVSGDQCATFPETCDDDCPDITDPTGNQCYFAETNTAPPDPTHLYYCVGGMTDLDDGACVRLSSDPNNPTVIRVPSSSQRVYFKTRKFDMPASSMSRGERYSFGIDNESNPPDCNAYQYDFCDPFRDETELDEGNYVFTENRTASDYGIQQGSSHRIAVQYQSMDRCDADSYELSNYYEGYIQFDNAPQVGTISKSPNTDISGQFPRPANSEGLTCDTANPIDITMRYSDADGYQDISAVGLWIDDVPPSSANKGSSAHGTATTGSVVYTFASGNTVGSYNPAMSIAYSNFQTYFDDIGTYNRYTYWGNSYLRSTAMVQRPLRLTFLNDRYYSSTEDRSLTIDKVLIDNELIQTDSETVYGNDCGSTGFLDREGLNCPNGYFEYPSNSSFGNSTGWVLRGQECNTDLVSSCGGDSGCDCWMNNYWGVHGGAVPSQTMQICSVDIDGDESYISGNCEDPVASVAISNISGSGNNLDVTWRVWFHTDDIGTDLDIYGWVTDQHNMTHGWVDRGDHTLDFTAPTMSVDPIEIIGSEEIELSWNVSDGVSNLTEIFGDASGTRPGLITDLTQPGGSANYNLEGDNRHLWQVFPNTGTTSRTENILLNNTEGNSIDFTMTATDQVCNVRARTDLPTLEIEDPWITTKGGHVFSSIDLNFPKRPLKGDPGEFLANDAVFQDPAYRLGLNGPNDIAVSTEWVGVGVPIFINPLNENFGYASYSYSNTQVSPIYTTLYGYYDDNPNKPEVEEVIISQGSITSYPGCSSDNCVFIRSGNLSSGNLSIDGSSGSFTCNNSSVFFISGNLSINPNIYKGSDAMDGCIFVVRGNVTITSGSNVSSDPDNPSYDLIEAYIIADGNMTLEDDNGDPIKDGLYVRGGLVAYGTGNSIVWDRSMVLLNNLRFPSTVVHHDNRYTFIAREILAEEKLAYKTSIGFKAL